MRDESFLLNLFEIVPLLLHHLDHESKKQMASGLAFAVERCVEVVSCALKGGYSSLVELLLL